MRVYDVHGRVVPLRMADAELLLAGLAGPDDRLWPSDRWWPQRFDGGLRPGAKGGHGPVRYLVDSVEPRRVVFRFPRRSWFQGTHRFELAPHPAGVLVTHTLDGKAVGRGGLLWPAVVRPLHDALVEDALDRAARAAGEDLPPRRYPWRVRMLRRAVLRRWPRQEAASSAPGAISRHGQG